MSSRPATKSITINAALSASVLFIPLVLSFIVTPILLHGVGTDAYGVYVIVLSFINYSFTFGMGKAAAKYVAEYRAAGDQELVNEAFSAAFWFSLLLGAVWAMVVFLSAPWFVDVILRIPADLFDEGRRSLQIAAVIIFVSMLSQVFSFTLQGLQRFDKFAAASVAGSVILNGGSIILVIEGFGVSSLIAWNLAATLLAAVFFSLSLKSTQPSLRLGFSIRTRVRRSVAAYGSAIIVTQIFGNILLLFERTWITRGFGVEALAYYVVPMMLAVLLHSLVGSIVMVLFPLVNERLADVERVANLYRSATKFVLAFAVFGFVCAGVLGQQLLGVWIGQELAQRSAVILIIHTATFGLLASATMAWNVAESFGKARVNVVFSAAWLLASGILMIILDGRYGLEGVAVARLIGVAAVIPLIYFVEDRILGTFDLRYWILNLTRLFAAAACAAAVQHLAAWTHGITVIVSGTLAGAGVFALLLWAAKYFTAEELSWLRRSLPWVRA